MSCYLVSKNNFDIYMIMVTCAVINCKNNSSIKKKIHGITFHRFPRDKHRCKQWKVAVNRESEWSPSEFSVVCSEHFNVNDFYLTDSGLRRLSHDAVPAINISPCQESQPTISTIDLDINPTDSEEVIALKQKLHRLEILAESRKRRAYKIWLAKSRLKKKLAKMKSLIKHLIMFKKNLDKNG